MDDDTHSDDYNLYLIARNVRKSTPAWLYPSDDFYQVMDFVERNPDLCFDVLRDLMVETLELNEE